MHINKHCSLIPRIVELKLLWIANYHVLAVANFQNWSFLCVFYRTSGQLSKRQLLSRFCTFVDDSLHAPVRLNIEATRHPVSARTVCMFFCESEENLKTNFNSLVVIFCVWHDVFCSFPTFQFITRHRNGKQISPKNTCCFIKQRL